MKLIIDIPERDYKNVSRIVDMGFGTNVDEAIKNGIPLDDVKAEIEKKCDRIDNILASILRYPQLREIQELLREIPANIGKEESEDV